MENINKNLTKKYEDYDISITNYNFANFFEVVPLSNGPIFNLHKDIIFKGLQYTPSSYYTLYKITQGDQWPLISFKYYDTIELWWVICKFNGITDPINVPEVGTSIKIPNKDIVTQILTQIKNN